MYDRTARARNGLVRAADQVLATLHQHLDRHVVGDQFVVDQRASHVELGVARAGEADFDLLEADVGQHLEIFQLLADAHRYGERLIAVAQVDAAPDRRVRDRAARPLAVSDRDLLKGAVFCNGCFLHVIMLQIVDKLGSYASVCKFAVVRTACIVRLFFIRELQKDCLNWHPKNCPSYSPPTGRRSSVSASSALPVWNMACMITVL